MRTYIFTQLQGHSVQYEVHASEGSARQALGAFISFQRTAGRTVREVPVASTVEYHIYDRDELLERYWIAAR